MCINNQVPVLFDLSMNVKMYGNKFVIMILPLISFFLSILHLFYEKEEKINKTDSRVTKKITRLSVFYAFVLQKKICYDIIVAYRILFHKIPKS